MCDYLSKEFYKNMKHLVKARVSEKRFEHIKNVAKTCRWIAKTYDLDVKKCKLAGVLHDWDKGLSLDEVVMKAKKLGLNSIFDDWTIQNLPNLLHGPTAAADFMNTYDSFPVDVAHAISVHTTADVLMNDIDMCLYVADAIEPGRHYDELARLRSMVGVVSLQKLYEEVFCLWTQRLIIQRKLIYSKTIDIYNSLISNMNHE